MNGLLKDAARLREGALVEESRRCEAIARSEGPRDDGPRGGGAPRAAAKDAAGRMREEGAAPAARIDPFAFLTAALGLELGAALGRERTEAPVSAGRAA